MSKILILDDDQNRLNIFKRNLIGHILTTTSTAQAAIDQLNINNPFDYVFLDHDLGGEGFVQSGPGTGYEVALWLSNHPEKKPEHIIIHSFNPIGSQKMSSVLPTAVVCPGVWNKISIKYV